jgi:hypothetical protein
MDEFLIMKDFINTDIGKCYLINLSEYEIFSKYCYLLRLQKFQILRILKKEIDKYTDKKQKKSFEKHYNTIKDFDFIEIIKSNLINGLYESYKNLFTLCFKKDIFDKIQTDKQLQYYTDLLIEINNINITKENPNPEIEWFNKLERMKNKETTSLQFKHIYTSVWAYTGQKPADNMTLYAFFSLFKQIAQFKN